MAENQSDITSKQGSSGWHIALAKASGDGHYLGSMDNVSGIVRKFMAGITDRYAVVADGRSTPWDAADADKAECEHMARIFTGKDPDYTPMGKWNTGEGLGRFLAAELEGIVAPEELADADKAIAQAFALVAHKVYEVLASIEDANSLEEHKARLETISNHFTRSLMGVHTELFDH